MSNANKVKLGAQSRAGMAQKAEAAGRAKSINPNDPTPERMTHDTSVQVPPAWGEDDERTVLKVRRFRTTKVDQLYAEHKITRAQRDAAEWWRTKQEDGLGMQRVVGDYGQSNGARASGDPSPLPLSSKAEAARTALAAAKKAMTLAHRLWIEDVLDDPHPRLAGRAVENRRNRWRAGLQALAVYLELA